MRFTKASTPLLLVAAALEPTGILVAFNGSGSGGDWRWAGLITAGVMAVQFVAIFASLKRSTPLFMTIFFGALFWWTALDLADLDDETVALIIGATFVLTGIGVDRSGHRDISPAIYFFGSVGFLVQPFRSPSRRPCSRSAFIAAAAGFVYLSVLLAQPHAALRRHARDPRLHRIFHRQALRRLGGLAESRWIVFGMLMIGLSALAFRIDRDYVRAKS